MTPETPDPPPVSPSWLLDAWDAYEMAVHGKTGNTYESGRAKAITAVFRQIHDAARAADALRHRQAIAALERKQHDANCELRGPGGAVDRRCSCGFRALRTEIIAARAALSTAEATIQQQNEELTVHRDMGPRVLARLAAAEATIAACAPFLKDGETPAECIERNRADTDAVLRLLAQEKATKADWRSRAWTAEMYQAQKVGLRVEIAEALGIEPTMDDGAALQQGLAAIQALQATIATLDAQIHQQAEVLAQRWDTIASLTARLERVHA